MGYIDKLKETKKKSGIPALVVEMMDAATKIHILHLTVTGPGSYAAHKALNELYDALPDLADTIAESYQGVTGTILDYPDVKAPKLESVKAALAYIDELHDKVSNVQDANSYSEIDNELDNVKTTLNSAKYKLKFLA